MLPRIQTFVCGHAWKPQYLAIRSYIIHYWISVKQSTHSTFICFIKYEYTISIRIPLPYMVIVLLNSSSQTAFLAQGVIACKRLHQETSSRVVIRHLSIKRQQWDSRQLTSKLCEPRCEPIANQTLFGSELGAYTTSNNAGPAPSG